MVQDGGRKVNILSKGDKLLTEVEEHNENDYSDYEEGNNDAKRNGGRIWREGEGCLETGSTYVSQ